MAERLPFFTLFESFQAPRQLRLLLHDAYVTGGALDREARTIEVQAVSSETVPEAAVTSLEHMLAQQYDLRRVQLRFSAPAAAGKGGSDLLYGKEIKGRVVPVGELNLKMGSAVVEGRVFGMECYETRRPGQWCMNFDMTDEHGSVSVRKYMDDVVAQAKERGYVETLWHRRRALPELKSSNFNMRSFGERVALNMPIQGTAADIIKLAMVRVHRRLAAGGLEARLIMQVHDELIVECPEAEASRVEQLLQQEMQGVAELSVPLLAEAHTGHNWLAAKG